LSEGLELHALGARLCFDLAFPGLPTFEQGLRSDSIDAHEIEHELRLHLTHTRDRVIFAHPGVGCVVWQRTRHVINQSIAVFLVRRIENI
jgi:hypothetical protein